MTPGRPAGVAPVGAAQVGTAPAGVDPAGVAPAGRSRLDPAGWRETDPAGPDADVAVVALQLGRPPRGVLGVAHRCPCGLPDVVETAPRLPDGTPFPTLYYLTCPRATAAMSRLEAAGLMREMTRRLAEDPELMQAQVSAHRDYLARRDTSASTAGVRPLPPDAASAGGMPDRVKCLHALAAHELAVEGSNQLGGEAVQAAGSWWASGPCVTVPPAETAIPAAVVPAVPAVPAAGTAVPAAVATPAVPAPAVATPAVATPAPAVPAPAVPAPAVPTSAAAPAEVATPARAEP